MINLKFDFLDLTMYTLSSPFYPGAVKFGGSNSCDLSSDPKNPKAKLVGRGMTPAPQPTTLSRLKQKTVGSLTKKKDKSKLLSKVGIRHLVSNLKTPFVPELLEMLRNHKSSNRINARQMQFDKARDVNKSELKSKSPKVLNKSASFENTKPKNICKKNEYKFQGAKKLTLDKKQFNKKFNYVFRKPMKYEQLSKSFEACKFLEVKWLKKI